MVARSPERVYGRRFDSCPCHTLLMRGETIYKAKETNMAENKDLIVKEEEIKDLAAYATAAGEE